MNKTLITAALLLSQFCTAQKKESVSPSKIKTTFYVGAGLQSTDNYNINTKLSSVNLPQINQNMPEIIFGLNLVGKKYSSDFEVSTAYSNVTRRNMKNEYLNTSARIRLHRNISVKEKTLFTAGANIAFAGSSVNLFSENNVIDMNNLANTSNVNHISLRNGMIYLGPSVSFTAFRKASFPLRVNVGYEIGLLRGRWRSDYTAVNNMVGEFGKNRLIISLNLM
jgi:hypothetical protein